MGKVDKSFHYTSAANSSKPGYLSRRFAQIRKDQAEAEAKAKAAQIEAQAKVRPIAKKGAA